MLFILLFLQVAFEKYLLRYQGNIINVIFTNHYYKFHITVSETFGIYKLSLTSVVIQLMHNRQYFSSAILILATLFLLSFNHESLGIWSFYSLKEVTEPICGHFQTWNFTNQMERKKWDWCKDSQSNTRLNKEKKLYTSIQEHLKQL